MGTVEKSRSVTPQMREVIMGPYRENSENNRGQRQYRPVTASLSLPDEDQPSSPERHGHPNPARQGRGRNRLRQVRSPRSFGGAALTFGIIAALGISVIGVIQFTLMAVSLLHAKAEDWIGGISPTLLFILCLVAVLIGLAMVRSLFTVIVRSVSFAFKFAQSDVVTVALALIINVLLLLLDFYFVSHLFTWTPTWGAGVTDFFSGRAFWAPFVVFVTFAAVMVWIPRTGLYGENRLGQFDDGR